MTGFRVDTAVEGIKRKLGKLQVNASAFRPELEKFTARSFASAIQMTPVRDGGLISRNQARQYEHRINYIPSYHEVLNPTLIVKDEGEFLFIDGKWYRPDKWRLPAHVWSAYQLLMQERERRMQTAQSDFIAQRKQARFLYQKSWWQVAQSLGLTFAVAAAVISSRTRRKPPVDPPKGYGQWRGGVHVLSVVIRNVFLSISGKYWKGNGKQILRSAAAQHRERFNADCQKRVKKIIAEARKA